MRFRTEDAIFVGFVLMVVGLTAAFGPLWLTLPVAALAALGIWLVLA